MLAELAEIQGCRDRWEFALGCAWVVAFPPGGYMQAMKNSMVAAMLISTALVAPLIYLELLYAMNVYSDFPWPLFVMLWLIAASFIVVAVPMVRSIRTGQSLLTRPGVLVARLTFLIFAAVIWTGIVKDQMPCFLGVPYCD